MGCPRRGLKGESLQHAKAAAGSAPAASIPASSHATEKVKKTTHADPWKGRKGGSIPGHVVLNWPKIQFFGVQITDMRQIGPMLRKLGSCKYAVVGAFVWFVGNSKKVLRFAAGLHVGCPVEGKWMLTSCGTRGTSKFMSNWCPTLPIIDAMIAKDSTGRLGTVSVDKIEVQMAESHGQTGE